jgi:formylglycine-generating enzyme required for sulfatase activity
MHQLQSLLVFVFFFALGCSERQGINNPPADPPPTANEARLHVSRDSILVDGLSSPIRLGLLNSGQTTLEWRAWVGADWLSLAYIDSPSTADGDSLMPLSGTGPVVLLVQPQDQNLTPGTYQTQLHLRSNGGDIEVPVRLEVGALSPPPPNILHVDLPGGAGMEFVWIEPGSFLMGSFASEAGHRADEAPPHQITIEEGFYIGRFEITQGQWQAVSGRRPWVGNELARDHDAYPATSISWNDIEVFLDRLNTAAGIPDLYRLPTEAEWEYAARAGQDTPWSFGLDPAPMPHYTWYRSSTWDLGLRWAQAVGTKRPNAWGLYDMHGNVWEWVADWYESRYYRDTPNSSPLGPLEGSSRVLRGGGFVDGPLNVRAAARFRSGTSNRSDFWGARIVRQP